MRRIRVLGVILLAAGLVSPVFMFPQNSPDGSEQVISEDARDAVSADLNQSFEASDSKKPQESGDSASTAPSSAITTVPDVLRRPLRGEAPRYPRDMIIGELGQGTAPDEAWQFALQLISSLLTSSRSISGISDAAFVERTYASLETVEPVKYHIGGGRTEEDGSVSFLVRFLGREKWMTGELYLRNDSSLWALDDFLLEEGRSFEEAKKSYPYDFSPYERFF